MNDLPTDKERFVCLNCYAVGPLDDQLHCSKCQSDTVIAAETLSGLQPLVAAHELRHQVEQLQTQQKRFTPGPWYHIRLGSFETVVSYTKATTEDEALEYASSPLCQWYYVKQDGAEAPLVDITELKHEEYLQWCRRLWSLESVT